MVEHLKGLPPEIAVFIISALPVFELRGAIPIGVIYYNLPLWKVFLISLTGNLLPVPFLLLLLRPISTLTSRWWLTKKFFDFLYNRARRKGVSIKRLKILGLYLFVAIPIPGTGAWMGSVIAEVLNMDFKSSFLAISLGVITAGIVLTFVSSFGIMAVIVFFGIILFFSYIISRNEGTSNQ